NELDHLSRLKNSDNSREHAQDTSSISGRGQICGRRFGEHTPVAWPLTGTVDGHLSFESEDAAINDRLLKQHARIVEQIPGREIVRPVDDDVVVGNDVQHIGGAKPLLNADDFDIRIEVVDECAGRLGLWFSDTISRVYDLTLEVAEID